MKLEEHKVRRIFYNKYSNLDDFFESLIESERKYEIAVRMAVAAFLLKVWTVKPYGGRCQFSISRSSYASHVLMRSISVAYGCSSGRPM